MAQCEVDTQYGQCERTARHTVKDRQYCRVHYQQHKSGKRLPIFDCNADRLLPTATEQWELSQRLRKRL